MHKAASRNGHSRTKYDIVGDVEKIKRAFADASYDIRGKAGEVFTQSLDNAREKTTAAQENVTGWVTEKPLKSLGIALAAGMLLGYLIRK